MLWFKWYLFACNLLIPVMFLVCGILMQKHCPKRINNVIGYRTARSMKNDETWHFAHDYIGGLWKKIGIITTAATIIVQVLLLDYPERTLCKLSGLLMAIQAVLIFISIIMTEKALKNEFPE